MKKTAIKDTGATWISLALMFISAGVAITAIVKKWPFRSVLFPVIIGLCVFLLSLAYLSLELFGKKEDDPRQRTVRNVEISSNIDRKTETSRTISIFLWIFLFFLLAVFLGLPVATPLLIFSYLKFQNKESWGLSLLLTGATILFFYILFVWLMEAQFPSGLLVERLI